MYFTEAQLAELRAALPVGNISVVDSLVSTSVVDALSANQGRLLGERLAHLEETTLAASRIETIYEWSAMSSMVSVPLDTPNTLANARTVYELMQMLSALGIRVTTLENLVSQIGSSGGGGGTGIDASLVNGEEDTTIYIGVNSATFFTKAQVIDYVATHGGGGGGTAGGYIGTTQVQVSSSSGQQLTGLSTGTFSGLVTAGSLSVTGTSTLTGNVTTNGTVSLLGSTKRIYFGSVSDGAYIEYADGQFHFSKGLYSDYNVTAGGIGSGGGGGGGSTSYAVLYTANQGLSSTQQRNARENIDAQKAFVTIPTSSIEDGSVVKYVGGTGWTVGTISGGGGGSNTLSGLADVNMSGIQSNHILYYNKNNGTWYNAPFSLANLNDIDFLDNPPSEGDVLTYSSGTWVPAPVSGGGGSGTNTWRNIYVNGSQWKSTGTGTGYINFKAGTNVTLSTSGNNLTISATGGGGSGSEVSISNLLLSGTRVATLTIDSNNYDIYAPSSSGSITITQLGNYGTSTPIFKYNTGGSDVTIYGPSGGSGGSDSWRPVQVNGTQKYSSLTDSGALNLKGSCLSWDTTSGNTGVRVNAYFSNMDNTAKTVDVTLGNGSTGTSITTYKLCLNGYSSGGSGGSTTLAGLSDVELSSLNPNDVLTYSSGKWRNLTVPRALGDLSNVSNTTPSSGQFLVYNGTSWTPLSPTLDDIPNGSNRKLPIDISLLAGYPVGYNNDKLRLDVMLYDSMTTGRQSIFSADVELPHADDTHAGIVGVSAQSFAGVKTFVNNMVASSKVYIGGTTPNYYLEYNSTDKCLHLYCGTGVSGSGTKLKIHGNVEVTGNIVATGAITAGA